MQNEPEKTWQLKAVIHAIAFVAVAILVPVALIVDGIVFSTVYNWFVPEIYDLPVITVVQAIALMFVVAAFRSRGHVSDSTYVAKQRAKNWMVGRAVILVSALILKTYFFN